MVLQRWDPTLDVRRMDVIMGRLWRGFGGRSFQSGGGSRYVPLDVVQDGDNVVVSASLPGVSPDDIKVDIEDGVLSIKAETSSEKEGKGDSYLLRERRPGSYHRSIRLPDTVNADGAESSYEHGVVTITLPKQEEKKARRIELKVS